MNLVSDVAATPGWYGKLPSLGDFASRRLEADFVEPWDLWLGEGLQAHRDSLGEGWLDAYLQSPVWRFILLPGALASFDPRLVVTGVLMPSVDRVGRYFPLTLASTLSALPTSSAQYEALFDWLDRLENIALAALQQDWAIDQLEEALAALGSPAGHIRHANARLQPTREALGNALRGPGGFVVLHDDVVPGDLAELLAGLRAPDVAVSASDATSSSGRGLWIAKTGEGASRLLVSRGLPTLDDFMQMFVAGGGTAFGGLTSSATRASGAEALAPFLADPPAPSQPQTLRIEEATVIPDDADLLGLFAKPAESMPLGGADAAQGLRDLLAAGDEARAREPAGAKEKSKDDDILALFDGGTDKGDDSVLPESEQETRPGSPDILDLFDASGAKPDFDKTR